MAEPIGLSGPGFTPCECGCNRAQHVNGRGMCNGYHCRCSRFVKRTRQFVHMAMMRAALSGAIDVIESLPGDGRTIKVGIPTSDERIMIVRQMKAALIGPKLEGVA